MTEQIIQTRRGKFGRVNVTLPMPVKESMLRWARKTGMSKAEFLRSALMIGAGIVADNLLAKKPGEGYYTEATTEAQGETASS